jgi:hypothetical protein
VPPRNPADAIARKREAVRTLNDDIAQKADESLQADFVCECASAGCFAVVPMTAAEWLAATAAGGYHVIRPGHEGAEELVVAGTRFAVVRAA